MKSTIHSNLVMLSFLLGVVTAMAMAMAMPACGPAAGGPPEIVIDRTACDHCRMLISDEAYSAAFRIGERQAVFDDIGCLLIELADAPDREQAQVWFHDVRDGGWLAAAEAVFVRSSQISTPMASGVVAVGNRAAATELVAQHTGEIFDSLGELLELVEEADVLSPGAKDGAHGQ